MPQANHTPLRVAIVGAGWAGLAAAIQTTQDGHITTVFEASSAMGGRARALKGTLPDGTSVLLDNGQHILIGAYTETLGLMRQIGIDPNQVLQDTPMALVFPDGLGLRFPNWPTPLDALAGIVAARGWSLGDKWSLIRAATVWQLNRFVCDEALTVAQLCQALRPRVKAELIEPLCVSALNTPAATASASVFLRVLRDALFGVAGGSHLLLPTTDLSAVFPDAAAAWLVQRGAQLRLSTRVDLLQRAGPGWQVNGQTFDVVIFANPVLNVALALTESALLATNNIADEMLSWTAVARGLHFEAITTVYAWAADARLHQPMLALRSTGSAPAQFVFDRGQLGGPQGLLAFVISASQGERATLQSQVLAQAQNQLGLDLQAVQTVVEKRATFACTPGLKRPAQIITTGLLACGDSVAGPYPATLEGAVRSGLAAAKLIRATNRPTCP